MSSSVVTIDDSIMLSKTYDDSFGDNEAQTSSTVESEGDRVKFSQTDNDSFGDNEAQTSSTVESEGDRVRFSQTDNDRCGSEDNESQTSSTVESECDSIIFSETDSNSLEDSLSELVADCLELDFNEEEQRHKDQPEGRQPERTTRQLDQKRMEYLQTSPEYLTYGAASNSYPKHNLPYEFLTTSEAFHQPTALKSLNTDSDKSISVIKSDSRSLFVENLPVSVKRSELKDLFTEYGTISGITVEFGRGSCSAFIMFRDAESVQKFINAEDSKRRQQNKKELSPDCTSRKTGNFEKAHDDAYSRKQDVINYPYSQRLYVGELPYFITEEDLKNIFGKFGTILDLEIIRKKKNWETRRAEFKVFAFIVFSDADTVQKVLYAEPIYFHGRRLIVQEKRYALKS